MPSSPNLDPADLIAVVGLAGRFPGAPDLEAFWQLLDGRGDAIAPIPASRWDASAQLDPERTVQAVGGFLDDVDQFDPTFFGISPREAEDVDPQQRLFLEAAWKALEDGGVPAASIRGSRTGVYVGASWHDYEILRKERGAGATQHSAVGNALDVTAARVSYFLKLKGPSLVVETGCSSAMVALHLAGQAVLTGELDGALVGGVNLILTPDVSVNLTHFGGLSNVGRCQAFSAKADGFVRGEGIVAVYLKRLDKAIADGDRIRGVLVATAVNNDAGGESLVTPNPDGQTDLLTRTYAGAGIDLDKLAYVEAHGTGTLRGDPVEAGAIGRTLAQHRTPGAGPLAIGSVKTNIGHLEATAGLAGLAKVLVSIEHGKVPASLHAEELNPAIPFDELNLVVARDGLDLPDPAAEVSYLGVNSFGWGGTNAHVIVATPALVGELTASTKGTEATAGATLATDLPTGLPVVMAVTGHNEEAFKQRAGDLAELLSAGDAIDLEAVAASLGHHRDHFAARAGVVATSAAEAADALSRLATGTEDDIPATFSGRARAHGRTAFVFPGQGSQWAAMGATLLAESPVFAATIDRCSAALAPFVDWDLEAILAGRAGEEWMKRIDMLQPVLWAVSLGIAELWRASGVSPDVVIGHSQGEVTAATFAGILSYEDAALVMARRSAIARRTSGRGRMLAVDLDVAGAQAALAGFEDQVSIAVNNGPSSCVLSGDTDAVLILKELLDADGTFCRLVNVDYASHSPQMDELTEDLLAALEPVRPRLGDVPILSTVLVEELDGSQLDAAYWTSNLRRPVLFADTLAKAFEAGVTHVIEISPHSILGPAIEQLAALQPEPPAVVTSLRRDQGRPADFAFSLAKAYVAGLEPFGAGSQESTAVTGRAVAKLPAYPWQRTSYWVPAGRRRGAGGGELEVALRPSSSEADAWTATLEVGVDGSPWLRDHQVHDAIVLPGAGMLALALATATARSGSLPAALSNVSFLSDLTLTEEDAAQLTVSWRDDVAQGGSFTLQSLPSGATSWTTHATARAELSGRVPKPRNQPQTGPLDPFAAFPAELAAAEVTQTTEEFYAACSARGLNYGPAFQAVLGVALDGAVGTGARSLAHVVLPKKCLASARAGALHPALWDGALQVSLALFDGSQAVVPTSVRRIDLHPAFAEAEAPVIALWSHAVRRDDLDVDLYLFDEEGRPLLTMLGLQLTELESAAEEVDAEPRVFRLAFRETEPLATRTPELVEAGGASSNGEHSPSATSSGSPEPVDAGRWLVVGAGPDGAGDIAIALSAAGAATSVVSASGPDLRPQVETALTGGDVVEGVVALVPTQATDAVRRSAILTDLAEIVRACSAQAAPPQLSIVTVTAQAVPGDGVVPDPAAALAWGFGRVARREHPELEARLLDVDQRADGWAPALAAELLGGRAGGAADDQTVLRGPRRWAGRLVAGTAGAEADSDQESDLVAWATPAQPFRLVPARPGFWDGLEFRPLSRRAPGAGEIELQVSGAALNFIDVMKAMGTYPDPSGGGDLLGGEAVGTVVSVGEGVSGYAVGDRVVACVFGAIASHVTVRVEHSRPAPSQLSDADAVGLPLVLLTAWYGLHDLGRLDAGETVLIHSATGGLGLAAVAVAKLLGAEVIATAGTEAKRAWLREQGITHVFDSRDLSWADGVAEVTGGRGVDVVLNSLTGAAIPLGLDALAEDGRFIEVGKKNIYGGMPVSLSAFRKGISFAAVDLAGLMSRRPARFAALFEQAWQHVESGAIAPLPVAEYPFDQAGEALRQMAQGTHIGKFVVTDPSTVAHVAPEPLVGGSFRSDGTYLISGGLGALGLSLAAYLGSRGAGALALVGRSAPKPDALAAIEALRSSGATVEVFAADVADADSVAELVEKVRATLPPLRGVVHAAGLLDDATILTMAPGQVDRVLAPKVSGALNLDAATSSDALDLFVVFSSAASLIGNAGQAAYAAGNSAMDALVTSRRRRGLPGLSVQWGPFAEIGLAAAGDHRGARLEDRGMGSFTASEGWEALTGFLTEGETVVGYVPMNLRQWFDAYPDTAAQPTWEVLRAASQSGSVAGAGGNEFVTVLASAAEGERADLVEGKVRQLVGRVLRLDPSAVDRETPFKALGLDSLMGLELRNRLESAFGLKLSPTLLWTYGSSRALAGELCVRLFAEVEG